MESSPWRCGSCEARFVDASPSPRCPKCLKRSLVERADPAPVPVFSQGAADAPSEPVLSAEERDKQEKVAGRALLFATMPAVIAAFLVSGWFGFRVDPMIALLFAVGTAPIAGWLVAKSLGDRIFASIAAMIGAVGIVIATTWYIHDRRHMVNIELFLPMLVGGFPGLALFYAFRALAPAPLARRILAAVAVLAAVALVATC